MTSDRRLLRYARCHRAEPTRAESMLWADLRNRQLGYKFRRQQPIGPYIVDFVCFSARLIVELDGWSHTFDETYTSDVTRQAWLERQGYTVVRFGDQEVLEDRSSVANAIYVVLQSSNRSS